MWRWIMHLIDQDLSGINQLGAIVGAISGYHCGKQPGQLCLRVDRQIIGGREKSCKWWMWLESLEMKQAPTSSMWHARRIQHGNLIF